MHGQVTRSPQSGAAVGLTSGARTSPQEIGFAAHEAGDSSIAGSLSPSSNRSSIGLPTKPIPISRGRGNLAEDGAFSQGYPSHAQSLPPQAPVIGSLPYPSGLASPPPFELAPSSPDTSTLQRRLPYNSVPNSSTLSRQVLHRMHISRRRKQEYSSIAQSPVFRALESARANLVVQGSHDGIDVNVYGGSLQMSSITEESAFRLESQEVLYEEGELSEQAGSHHDDFEDDEEVGDDEDVAAVDGIEEEVDQFQMEGDATQTAPNAKPQEINSTIDMKPLNSQNVNEFLR